jgi:hypothetical protein
VLEAWPAPAVLALVTAAALAVWLSAGAWGGAAPPGDDTAARLVGVTFGIDHLMAEGRHDGWQPRFGLGYQAFLFIGPGLVWTVAAVRGLSLGLLSSAGAYTTVVVGSFVALPLAVAFLARSFALSRRAAGISAVLTLVVSGPFAGVGLHSQFAVGLVTNGLGALWWCLALGAIVRQLTDPRLRWVVLAGTSGAALILTHLVSVLVLALVASLVVATVVVVRAVATSARPPAFLRLTGAPGAVHRRKNGGGAALGAATVAGRLALSALVALGLSAVMVVPLLAHRDLQGAFTGFVEPPLGEHLATIWRGEAVVAPGVAPWLLAGMVFACFGALLALRGRRLTPGASYLALVLVPPAYLLVAHGALQRWPDSLVARQLPTRGLGNLAILALFPLGALLAGTGRRLGRSGELAAVLVAAALVVLPLGWPVERPTGARPGPSLRAAAHRLAELVPDGARFATQRDFPAEIEATGVAHPDFWLAWLSGRDTLNIFNAESTVVGDPVFEPERIGRSAPGESADALARLGVTHVVLVDEEGATELVASPRFERVWRSPPLSILAVQAPTGQPSPSSLVTTTVASSARLVRDEDEHLVIETDATASTSATVAVGWSPKWHARLDGRPVALERSADGLLSLDLPAGEHTLALRFRPDGWDRLGQALSLASALGMVAGVIVSRVNSVRTGAAGVSVAGVSRRRWRRPREPAGTGPESSRAGRGPSRSGSTRGGTALPRRRGGGGAGP